MVRTVSTAIGEISERNLGFSRRVTLVVDRLWSGRLSARWTSFNFGSRLRKWTRPNTSKSSTQVWILFVDDFIEFRWFFNKIMRASTRAKKLWHGLDVRKSTFWTGLLEVLIWIRLRIYGASLCAESTPKIDNSKRLMLSKAPSKQLGRQSTVKWFKTWWTACKIESFRWSIVRVNVLIIENVFCVDFFVIFG